MSARGADRKAAIIDAAVERIVKLGFEGLRVRDVARDVGINNATLHHHFPTKAALVTAIVQRFVAEFATAGGVPADGSLDERLAAYAASRREQMQRAPATFVVLNELMVLACRDDEVCRVMAGVQTEWRNYLISVCREAGADLEAATERADRCRRELLGSSLDLLVSRRLG